MLHVLVPHADYSRVFAGQDLGALAILGLRAAGRPGLESKQGS